MHHLLSLLVMAQLSLVACAQVELEEAFVYGGSEVANIEEAPWIVALSWHDEDSTPLKLWYHCAGAHLGGGWVLTAAHCVADIPEDETGEYFAVFDRVNLDQIGEKADGSKPGFFFKANANLNARAFQEIILHDDFSASTLASDLALVRVENFDSSTASIMPAALVETMAIDNWEVLPFNSSLTESFEPLAQLLSVHGWGDTELSEEDSDGDNVFSIQNELTLKKTQQTLMARTEAVEQLGDNAFFPDSMIASMSADGGVPCKGDSGGPVVTTSRSGRKYLVGVHSWNGKPCNAANPSVHGRISGPVLDWIRGYVPAAGAP